MGSSGVRTIPFKYEHLARLYPELEPHEAEIDIVGVSVFDGDGELIVCGGVIAAPWGPELWIEHGPAFGDKNRLSVARLARNYVRLVLESEPELFATHSKELPPIPRWLRWLGFEYREDIQDGTLQQWSVRSDREEG